MIDTPSLELLMRWRDRGDQRAVEEFLNRHLPRLIAIIRKRLSARLGRRLDAEDVVQSACRSFCVRIRDGRLDVEATDSFEKLLVRFAVNKLLSQLEYHRAAKRTFDRERSASETPSATPPSREASSRDPAPEDVVAIQEEVDRLLAQFQPLHRRMIELRLLGHETRDIAAETQRTERMVRKVLAAFGELASDRLSDAPR